MIAAVLWGGLAAASLLIGFYLATRRPSQRATGLIMGIGAGAIHRYTPLDNKLTNWLGHAAWAT